MKSIRDILKSYSNTSLAQITGYPDEHIHMFRKNDIDHFAIRTDKTGRGIPTRPVMEDIIEEKVNKYEKELKRKFNLK
ncbi:MAG: hypothetical protein WC879_03405 [Melioribacteraceae bacterium]